MGRWVGLGGVVLLGVALAIGLAATGRLGRHRGPGEVTATRLPDAWIQARAAARAASAPLGSDPEKQILFGDLHVHTTFSTDAFMGSLPFVQGEGAHPPADACDFARFCSQLDFWSINDHAEALTPRRWQETIESVRQCNAVAGDPDDPDVVAFLGWEWTQVGRTPADHYGHKNVVLRGTTDAEIPYRPIAAGGLAVTALREMPLRARLLPALLDFPRSRPYLDFDRFIRELQAVPECDFAAGLEDDCIEVAATPRELFERLDALGFDSLVIPHGTSWGMYTPPGSTWRKQLTAEQHDPDRQTLIEVFSGHGNSEEYRDFRAVEIAGDGSVACPEPGPLYEPSCWRAGELIRERCLAAGEADAECDARAAEARRHHAEAGVPGHHTVPGSRVEDWLDAGQCRDCFLPAFNYRPGGSAQYVLAVADPESDPSRFRMGFIASSDNHTARPGTGYKEVARGSMSDRRGPRNETWYRRLAASRAEPAPRSVPFEFETTSLSGFQLVEFERQATFFVTGGLVAVHAAGRDRGSIWDALERKEVYGTSGPRILLWFDLLNTPRPVPMGSDVALSEAPRFRVRAVGAFEQEPGCPERSSAALAPAELERLCRGECHNPSDERARITRIEIVRIRPQVRVDEDLAALIEDPWRSFPCVPDPAGCSLEFEDPEFAAAGRDAVYYARAVQEPAPGINADGLRCRRDEAGRCVSVEPCWGDYRTDPGDDCLAQHEPRAWSSPIFVDHVRGR